MFFVEKSAFKKNIKMFGFVRGWLYSFVSRRVIKLLRNFVEFT